PKFSGRKMKPAIRGEHVGKLLPPQRLHETRAKNRRGELADAELKKKQDKDLRQGVKLQEAIGLPSITDGEFRRDWWHIDFLHGFDGVQLAKGDAYGEAKFKGTDEQPPFMLVQGKIRRSKPNMVEHFKFLNSLVTKGMAKFTMPSPAMLHARGDRASIKKSYPNLDNFWEDLTKIGREEIRDLYAAGCPYLQIADPTIAMWGAPEVQA